MHFFIYNPYSIVKETLVAKTNAERNRLDCAHRLSRGYSLRSLRNSHNQQGVMTISAQQYARRVASRGADGRADWLRKDWWS